MPGTFDNVVLRCKVLMRYFVLRRQLSEVSRTINRLSPVERRLLADAITRERDALERELRDAAGAEGYSRLRSENPHLRLRGIAQWVSATHRETDQSPYEEMRELHRQVTRVARLLREERQALGGVG